MTEEKELIEYLAKKLVDEPDGVSVKVIEGEKSTILELKVNQSDIGKIIGKRGRIAQCLRLLTIDYFLRKNYRHTWFKRRG